MVFLLNNPAIAFIFLVVAAFTLLMAIKIGFEINLNNLLKLKHKRMRLSVPNTHIKSRIAWLTTAAVTPAILVAVLLSIGLNQDYEFNDVTVPITSLNDINSIFEEFNRLNDSTYNDYSINIFRTYSADNILALDDGLISTAVYGEGDELAIGSDDYSETNSQVTGVDEMDSVITDGLNIYTFNGQRVTITRAFTEEQGYNALDILFEIDYSSDVCEEPQFFPNGLYIDDDYLVVVGSSTSNYNCGESYYSSFYYWNWWLNNDKQVIKVYDKTTFLLQDEYEFDGYLKGTRKVDNNLFVITTQYLPFNASEFDLEKSIPVYNINGNKNTVSFSDISYVEGTTPNAFTTFYGIDLDTQEIDSEVILGDGSYNIYVSNENIYIEGIVYTYYLLNDFINIDEPYITRTAINKISFDGNNLEFVATGYIQGHTLNQYSLDEYNGYLRVATTEGWGESTINRVTILDENLEVTSVIDEGLGKPGERITASRFYGDFGYVVTYLNIDPFYTLDLSDPYNPKITGELEITGFSTHLQLLNKDYMFSIGFDTNDAGYSVINLAVYDISDIENPFVAFSMKVDDEDYKWGWSSANYDAKDLLVDLNKGIVSIPFTSGFYEEGVGYVSNSGALVFNLDLIDGLELNGFVSHSFTNEYNIYGYKSEYIDNYLYVVTNKYISVSTIDDTANILKYIEINN